MTADYYSDFLEDLPLDTIDYAFAYGSGVMQQKDEEEKSKKMIDFVLVSKNSRQFHEQNLKQNGSHYSFCRWFGADGIDRIQRGFGAGIYYNTLIESRGRQIKYGVIEKSDFLGDLLDWRWLYVAGRLHKPVMDVIPPEEDVYSAINENRLSALNASLLQLPSKFRTEELFAKITSLSYHGDPRRIIGEGENKVQKIVHGSHEEFEKIYFPFLKSDQTISIKHNQHDLEQEIDKGTNFSRLMLLPGAVRSKLFPSNPLPTDEKLLMLAQSQRADISSRVETAINKIVQRSSMTQTLKSALTAGVLKSMRYGLRKLKFIK